MITGCRALHARSKDDRFSTGLRCVWASPARVVGPSVPERHLINFVTATQPARKISWDLVRFFHQRLRISRTKIQMSHSPPVTATRSTSRAKLINPYRLWPILCLSQVWPNFTSSTCHAEPNTLRGWPSAYSMRTELSLQSMLSLDPPIGEGEVVRNLRERSPGLDD